MTDTKVKAPSAPLYRIASNRAPIRRAGFVFPTIEPQTVPAADMSDAQLARLAADPMIVVEISTDGGKAFVPYQAATAS